MLSMFAQNLNSNSIEVLPVTNTEAQPQCYHYLHFLFVGPLISPSVICNLQQKPISDVVDI